ncbi:hypothetical protein DL95DRAFT_466801 [Leptodontidium sp. 2 PMI_412]|nr:hypothetical protein DL95DRAFT_466801 [Leptodontidium sp. 2 PMI_412]
MSRSAIINVCVFDGNQILLATTVVIDNGLILSIGVAHDSFKYVTFVDGQNGVLIPGLIDAHVHLHGPETLKQLAQLDMACWPPSLVSPLRIAVGKKTDPVLLKGNPVVNISATRSFWKAWVKGVEVEFD